MAIGYIGLEEMRRLTGKSHPTLWRIWAIRKEFPLPQKSKNGTFLGWPENIYDDWINSNNPNSTR
ncbi:helix-turn-helix transcriptional regulator [Sodalis sp. RH21]